MTDTPTRLRTEAQALEDAADELRTLDSTQGTPWSEHFDAARRAGRNQRAIAFIDVDDGDVTVSVSTVQSGAHYLGDDYVATIGISLPAFASVDTYRNHLLDQLKREIRDLRRRAVAAEEREQRAERER